MDDVAGPHIPDPRRVITQLCEHALCHDRDVFSSHGLSRTCKNFAQSQDFYWPGADLYIRVVDTQEVSALVH